MAVIAILSAILIPTYNSYLERSRIARLEETLTTLAAALRDFNRDTGQYPQSLFVLSRAPTLSDQNICGTSFTQAVVAGWKGPYIAYPVVDPGIAIETDTVLTTFVRNPVSAVLSTDKGLLQIMVKAVSSETATTIQNDLDGDGDLNTGVIQWNTSPGYPQMIFVVPIQGC